MIKKITDLVFQFFGVRILGCNHNLRRFLSDLFKNLVDSLVKQVVGVRSFLRMLFPVQDRGKHILEDSQRIAVVLFLPDKFFKETGTAACMAGCPDLRHLRQNRIIVAVKRQ